MTNEGARMYFEQRCREWLQSDGWALLEAMARGTGEDREWAVKLLSEYAHHRKMTAPPT